MCRGRAPAAPVCVEQLGQDNLSPVRAAFFILLYLILISKGHVNGGGVNLTTLLCLMQLIVPELEKNGAGCFQFLSHSK